MSSDSMDPCTNKVGWNKVSLAIDSGACDNVMDAEELLLDYKVHKNWKILNFFVSSSGLA